MSGAVRLNISLPPTLLTVLKVSIKAGADSVFMRCGWASCPAPLSSGGSLSAQWPPGLGTSVCMEEGLKDLRTHRCWEGEGVS